MPLALPALSLVEFSKRRFATCLASPGGLVVMRRARSSAGEHYVDIVGVTGSIPVAPTITPLRTKENSITALADRECSDNPQAFRKRTAESHGEAVLRS